MYRLIVIFKIFIMKELIIISALFVVSSLFSKNKVELKSSKIHYTAYPARELKRRTDYVKN